MLITPDITKDLHDITAMVEQAVDGDPDYRGRVISFHDYTYDPTTGSRSWVIHAVSGLSYLVRLHQDSAQVFLASTTSTPRMLMRSTEVEAIPVNASMSEVMNTTIQMITPDTPLAETMRLDGRGLIRSLPWRDRSTEILSGRHLPDILFPEGLIYGNSLVHAISCSITDDEGTRRNYLVLSGVDVNDPVERLEYHDRDATIHCPDSAVRVLRVDSEDPVLDTVITHEPVIQVL